MPKFKNIEEYREWCENTITKIYYANIALNNDAIRDAVAEIATMLHVPNHGTLIGDDEDDN